MPSLVAFRVRGRQFCQQASPGFALHLLHKTADQVRHFFVIENFPESARAEHKELVRGAQGDAPCAGLVNDAALQAPVSEVPYAAGHSQGPVDQGTFLALHDEAILLANARALFLVVQVVFAREHFHHVVTANQNRRHVAHVAKVTRAGRQHTRDCRAAAPPAV